jgi:TDG/mug DNA glycosylase family protein
MCMARTKQIGQEPGVGMSPVVGVGPRVLILGSMPGEDSLRARQYYAHARNAFWPIMEMLFEVPAEAPYKAKLRTLKSNKVALWDVIHS